MLDEEPPQIVLQGARYINVQQCDSINDIMSGVDQLSDDTLSDDVDTVAQLIAALQVSATPQLPIDTMQAGVHVISYDGR